MAPITLIGETLIRLLIENEIGVKKRKKLELWEPAGSGPGAGLPTAQGKRSAALGKLELGPW